jgi:serine/threonine protein kinase
MPDIKQYEPLWGSWYVDELIGEGSFGKVYKCRKEEFGRTYYSAVKIISIPQNDADLRQIRGEGMDEESARSYFQAFVSDIIQEIDLMSAFRGNSNVVSFEDHKVIERTDKLGWDILIRMELLTSLIDHANDKPLSQDDVVKLGIHICRALELCALKKTIHRDIKPDNIFVSEYGEYKLGDFGIARQIERTMSGLSKKGTYTYMAPEVFRGDDYGASVDIYSLGIVMYRYLNGGRTPLLPNFPTPITPRDRDDAMQRRMRGEVLPPIDNANPSLNAIVLKACAFDRSARFSTASEMREALEAIAGGGSYAPKVTEKPRPEVYEQAPTESTVGLFAEQSKTEATVGVFVQAPVNEPNEATSKTEGAWDSKPQQPLPNNSPKRYGKWIAIAAGFVVIVGIGIAIGVMNRAPGSKQDDFLIPVSSEITEEPTEPMANSIETSPPIEVPSVESSPTPNPRPETTSNTTAEVVPSTTPSPEKTPQPTLQTTPQPTPDKTPVPAPQTTPQPTPDSSKKTYVTNLEYNGGTYTGDWQYNMPNGQGTLVYSATQKYVGEWKDGLENGHGKEIFSDGVTNEGEWKNGLKNGYIKSSNSWTADYYNEEWENGKEISSVRIYSATPTPQPTPEPSQTPIPSPSPNSSKIVIKSQPETSPRPTTQPTMQPAQQPTLQPQGNNHIIINGTQYSTDSTELSLSYQGLTSADIEPLKYMTKLTTLSLNGNKISDISILADLK